MMTDTAHVVARRRSASQRGLTVLALLALLAAFAVTVSRAQEAPVGLGTAGDFAVLAGSTITNTGPTTITGDAGLHPGTAVTGFASVTHNGDLHVADAVALQAKNDLVTAYNDAAGRSPVTTVATELGGQVLGAGVYNSSTGTFGITGTLSLDAAGDPNAVFVLKTASTLITASASNVSLINGAQACNVFWQVGSSATLGTNSTFAGNILALTSVTANTGATAQGRWLARNGAVTMDTNTITRSVCAAAAPTPTPTPTPSPSPSPSPSPTPSPSPVTAPTQTPDETTAPTVAPTPPAPDEGEETSSAPVPVEPPTRIDTGGGGTAPVTTLAGLLALAVVALAGATALRRPARNGS